MVYLHSNSISKTASKRNNAPAVGAVLPEAGTKTQEQSSSSLPLLSEYTSPKPLLVLGYYLSHRESGSRGNCEHKMTCLGLPPSRKESLD